jgi:hypothetical protein
MLFKYDCQIIKNTKMKNINFLLISIVIPMFFLGSCDVPPWGCVVGNNRIAVEERIVGPFSRVASYGSFVVNVDIGDDYSLTVEADENLLPYIRTSIEGNTLILETRSGRCIRSSEPVTINVVTPNIERLKLAGSGVINANNFTSDELELELTGSGVIECRRIVIDYLLAEVTGSGVIELSGTTETTDFSISGSGLIKAIDLSTKRCYASISGSGNIYTYVNELLDVRISGSGNLYYDGNPQIRQNITGSGSVRRYK